MFLSVCFLLLASYCTARPLKEEQWDHFVFTQEWPQSICWELDYTEEEQCMLPEKTNFWTIHGLWPSFQSTHGPNYCTKDKFNESLISSLEDQLIINWPNLKPKTGKYSFWKHEWDKHGTCALSMNELNSELKYFKKVLELHRTFDITKGLTEAGFGPSDKNAYQYADLDAALESVLGVKGMVMCYNPRNEPLQYLAQIEFCLDKSFQPIPCPHHKYKTSLENIEQSLHQISGFESTVLESKEHSLQKVFKMRIPNKNHTNTLTDSSHQSPEFNKHELPLNVCSDKKEIIYPIIDHNQSSLNL